MRWPWQRDNPPAPEGVRFVMTSGEEIPVDCVYSGKDDDGLHVWRPAWAPAGRVKNILVRKLPPRTSLTLPEEWAR